MTAGLPVPDLREPLEPRVSRRLGALPAGQAGFPECSEARRVLGHDAELTLERQSDLADQAVME